VWGDSGGGSFAKFLIRGDVQHAEDGTGPLLAQIGEDTFSLKKTFLTDDARDDWLLCTHTDLIKG
jgi:hypothetical protein